MKKSFNGLFAYDWGKHSSVTVMQLCWLMFKKNAIMLTYVKKMQLCSLMLKNAIMLTYVKKCNYVHLC